MPIDWEKHHRFMNVPGWCGPTTVWMVLDACGIKKNVRKITRKIWLKWYGTPPQLMAAYLSRYFSRMGYEQNCNIASIRWHLGIGHIIIVNWMDGNEGHYSIVTDYDNGMLTMVDSSRERPWTYGVDSNIFRQRWWDTLGGDMRHDGLLIWVDPGSVKHV